MMFTSGTFEALLAYEKLDFGDKSLGEVVTMLNCLQKREEPALERTNKQRLVARWRNSTSIARIKHLM